MIRAVAVRDLPRLKDRSCYPWVYLGGYAGSILASGYLSAQQRIFIGRQVQEITDIVRDRFIDYVGAMAGLQPDPELWYASSLASKANSQTPVFDQYVYCKLLEILSSKEGPDTLVVTDDDALLQVIGQMAHKKVSLLYPCEFTVRHLVEFYQGSLKLVRYFLFWCISRGLPQGSAGAYDVIIPSWVDERTFRDPGGFNDPYLCGLGAWLKEQGFSAGRAVPLTVPLRFLGELGRRFRELLYPFKAVLLADLWKVLTSRFSVAFPADDVVEDGPLLRALVEGEVRRENHQKAYVGNLLLFYGYRALFKGLKDTACVIYPFEDQPWEKMLILALPARIRKIGYSHATIPQNWLCCRTSTRECSKPCPDVLLTPGQKWTELFRSDYQGVPIETAGALRYTYLTGVKKRVISSEKHRDVVVALPLDSQMALFLQSRLLSMAGEGGLDGLKLKIKPHPYLPVDALLTVAFAAYPDCSFVDDAVPDLLASCGLLITTASTVAFESVALGIKTLVYIPESVSWGIEYYIKENIFIAYEDDFSAKFHEAVASSNYPDWDVEAYFSRPDLSIFLKYLAGDKARP